MRKFQALLWPLAVFMAGTLFTTFLAVVAPRYVDALRDWWWPPFIEACSTLDKSEVTVIRETGEVALQALYPVDNHFVFYFHNRTGRDLEAPRLFLNVSGYQGRAPKISKMAVLVSSFASQQSADTEWEDGNIKIDLDVLPRNASVLFEMLVWEPISIHSEIIIDGKVEQFFQPPSCERDILELELRNISPVFEWAASECKSERWGMYCPRPNVEGSAESYAGEALSMEIVVVSKGDFLDPLGAIVQFPSHPQLISERMRTGISINTFDLLERDEEGIIAVETPGITLDIVSPLEE